MKTNLRLAILKISKKPSIDKKLYITLVDCDFKDVKNSKSFIVISVVTYTSFVRIQDIISKKIKTII